MAGLVTITTSLLFAAIIVCSTFEETDISQDGNTTEEVSISHSGVTSVSPNNSRVLLMSQVYCVIQNCVVTCSLIPTTSDPGLVASVFIDSEYEVRITLACCQTIWLDIRFSVHFRATVRTNC